MPHGPLGLVIVSAFFGNAGFPILPVVLCAGILYPFARRGDFRAPAAVRLLVFWTEHVRDFSK